MGNIYLWISVICLLIILSYGFTILARKTQIPSVLMLLFAGIVTRQIFDQLQITLPYSKMLLNVFGIVGLILIVLEGSLELELSRRKLKLARKAFFSALFILLLSSLAIAFIIKLVLPGFGFLACLVNAIPLAVISSAIAIPSVLHFVGENKEFIIYEAVFSDILGILLFNLVIQNPTFEWLSLSWVAIDLATVIIVSFIFTILLLFFIDRSYTNVKFFLLIAVLILLYNFGKMLHFSSLLVILIFGLLINNINIWWRKSMKRLVHMANIRNEIKQFRLIIHESTFLIRTFFFFIFGFTLEISRLLNVRMLVTGVLILIAIYVIRFFYLKNVTRRSIYPEILIAPRGLITILLFYSIPESYLAGGEAVIGDGLLFFIILITSIIMMIGLLSGKEKKIPLMEQIESEYEL